LAQFRTVADIQDSVLKRAGEVTNGNSAYETRSLEIINRIHRNIIVGGHELNKEVDEIWSWAQVDPIILELQPKYDTGLIAFTNGSNDGAFSSPPADSKVGWHVRINGRAGVYKIIEHTAAAADFMIDGEYDNDTTGGSAFIVFKIDYELSPSYLIVDSTNNKLDFEETASTELTSTLTSGSYTPAELATEIDTQLTADGASSYTITYDAVTRKFTLASDLGGGGGTFKLLCQSGTNQAKSAWALLGFDDEDQATAASHTSTYEQGSIARLIEPIVLHRKHYAFDDIKGLDKNRMQREYPVQDSSEGIPSRFSVIRESNEGKMIIRMNNYPAETARIEVHFIPNPRDLKDNAASIPIIPRRDIEVLEFGAAAEILEEKNDNRADRYFTRAASKLEAMVSRNRRDMQRRGQHFAQVIAREDLLIRRRRRLTYGVPTES